LKAKDNPFRTSEIDRLKFIFKKSSLEETAEGALELKFSAITGNEGSGKTALLNDLKDYFEKHGYDVLYTHSLSGHKKWEGDILLFDKGELLTKREIRILKKTALRFKAAIITRHTEADIPVLYKTVTDFNLLKRLLEMLGTCNRYGQTAEKLLIKNKGNIRETFLDMYDMAGKE